MPDRRPSWRPAALAVLAVALAGCGAGAASGGGSDTDERLEVVVSSYPLQFVAEEVGGDRVDITSLVPPGGDAHDVELTGAQVADLAAADVVLHVGGGLQPATDEALDVTVPRMLVDAADVVELESDPGADAVDPHFWLDPRLLADVADAAADAFATADPDGATGYEERMGRLRDRLLTLDAELAATLDGCDGALLVTSHEAFGYLTRRHGLEQVGLTGLDPHVPPSPARIRRVVEDYVTVMTANREALADGLVCTA